MRSIISWSKYTFSFFSLILLFFLLSCGSGGGGGGGVDSNSTPAGSAVALSWDVPTSTQDGQPMAEVAGYNLYYGTSPQTYSKVLDVGNVRECTLKDLPAGTYYISVTAYDSAGNETEFSEEVTKTVL